MGVCIPPLHETLPQYIDIIKACRQFEHNHKRREVKLTVWSPHGPSAQQGHQYQQTMCTISRHGCTQTALGAHAV